MCPGHRTGIKSHAVAVLLAVFTALTGETGWAEQLVLCICHEGDVSLEWGCTPVECCPDDIDGASPGTSVADPAHQHDCIDLPLLLKGEHTPRLRHEVSKVAPSEGTPMALPATAETSVDTLTAQQRQANGIAIPIAPSLSLRSVILLL
ncbi:MAG: hypothetical protein IT365_21815 [Candidatus Hydrogenedentes bacterium]|nr:hypothetical protein [Candidatus Hydrogenedentota bacterium]